MVENDSMEVLEGANVAATGTSLMTKAIRGFVAVFVLGSVTAYGAITVKPELVEYLSFVPGLEPARSSCSMGLIESSECGGCGSGASCCSEAGESATVLVGVAATESQASESCATGCPHCPSSQSEAQATTEQAPAELATAEQATAELAPAEQE